MGSNNKLVIRDARADEHDLFRAVTLSAHAEYAHKMSPEHWQEYQQVALGALDRTGSSQRIVAERDGVLVGSVLLFSPAADIYGSATSEITWPEVRLLAVLPSARGQGVGAALMEECARRARQMGATALGLHTSDAMQVAIAMYERMGFVRVPKLDFRSGDGQLVMAYRRDLGTTAPFLA